MPTEIPDDIADDLRRYLADEERVERARRIEGKVDALGGTLTTLTNQVSALTITGSAHEREDERRFKEMERRFDKVEDGLDDTGEHLITDLRGKVDDAKWWKRAIITSAIVLVTGGVSALVSHVWTRGTTPASASTK